MIVSVNIELSIEQFLTLGIVTPDGEWTLECVRRVPSLLSEVPVR